MTDTDTTPELPWVSQTTDATFIQDAIEFSRTRPVVVDFWAAWCGPCKQLAPLLERLAEEGAGQFQLVKAEVEKNQQAAASMRVESIPAVFGLRDGRVVDQFVGLLTEEQLRAWLAGLQPSEAERLMAEATAQAAIDPAAAEAKLRQVVALDARDSTAKLALAQLLLDQDRLVECESLIAELEERGFLEPEAEKMKAQCAVGRGGEGLGELEALRQKVAEKPDDLPAQWALARVLGAQKQYADALEAAVGLVQRDRHGLGEEARQLMVNIFHLLEPDDELGAEYRRKLSSALY